LALTRIDEAEARRYAASWPILCARVNHTLAQRADLRDLIGPNPFSVVQSNHENHAAFLSSVFVLRSSQCLTEVLVWVYRSYLARGFSAEYFVVQIAAWAEAIRVQQGAGDRAAGLLHFYDVLAESHGEMLKLAGDLSVPPAEALSVEAGSFLAALLRADERTAEALTRVQMRQAVAEVPRWWERVVAPALRTVGEMWSDGRISVAQEHMATAIAQRVMDRCFPELPTPPERGIEIAIVLPPGERHELAGRMVRDCLVGEGFRVLFTGADTPGDSVVALVANNPIDVLIIPTTMPYNLIAAKDLIRAVREKAGPRCPRIVVGGQAYLWDDKLWREVGADVCPGTLRALVTEMEALCPSSTAPA
jgi:methanogenic corrinoid protein MtbC1